MRRFIEQQPLDSYDVLIIGGGITGATIAYEACLRGLKTALVEMHDFSWATSAATSKMIHGGLRYLANGEIGLVRESLKERRILENIAPNFVYPMPILMPHSKKGLMNNKYLTKSALLLYDLLAYDKTFTWDKTQRIPCHMSIDSMQALGLEPGLRTKNLSGASIFYDCASVFPERLSLAFIKSAYNLGAHVANHAKAIQFLKDTTDRIIGAKIHDVLNGSMHEIKARITVNCGGPWADTLLDLASSQNIENSIRRSEGIHIITPKKLISGNYSIASMTPDNRHIFLIPWRGHTLIGTTDKTYTGPPDAYKVTKGAILELIGEVNATYGDGTLAYADVVHAYGGLRPLIEKQTKETYSLSRRYEILDNSAHGLHGLITVEGGKYTTSRAVANKCINLVQAKLLTSLPNSSSHIYYLRGCEICDIQTFFNTAQEEYPQISARSIPFLARIYGTELKELSELLSSDAGLAQTLNEDGEICAQVVYAIRTEMARTLADIVLRRTGIATLGYPGDECMQTVARLAAKELGWDESTMNAELEEVKNLLRLPET